MSLRGLLFTLVTALLVAGSAPASGSRDAASYRVWFRNGGSMEIRAIEPHPDRADTTRLTLLGGGTIALRFADLKRLEALAPPPPPAPVVAERAACETLEDPRIARWNDLVEDSAARHGLDPDLVRAVIAAESMGDPGAVSRKGAIGLMQLMPRTAADYGCIAPEDPAENIEAGCRHLARLHDRLSGRLDLVLAAYNAGEGTVARVGGLPPYRETRSYVRTILECLGHAWPS